MTNEELTLASKVAITRNISAHTVAATVTWNDDSRRLVLTYYLDQEATEEDEEQCELALGDLLAEFSEIVSAEGNCLRLQAGNDPNNLNGLMYMRMLYLDALS